MCVVCWGCLYYALCTYMSSAVSLHLFFSCAAQRFQTDAHDSCVMVSWESRVCFVGKNFKHACQVHIDFIIEVLHDWNSGLTVLPRSNARESTIWFKIQVPAGFVILRRDAIDTGCAFISQSMSCDPRSWRSQQKRLNKFGPRPEMWVQQADQDLRSEVTEKQRKLPKKFGTLHYLWKRRHLPRHVSVRCGEDIVAAVDGDWWHGVAEV